MASARRPAVSLIGPVAYDEGMEHTDGYWGMLWGRLTRICAAIPCKPPASNRVEKSPCHEFVLRIS